MTPGQKNLIRLVAVAIAGGLLAAFPLLWVPVVGFVGYEAYKMLFNPGGDSISSEERRMRRNDRKVARTVRRDKRRVYREHFSPLRGWKAESFPPGMTANVGGAHDASITLDACGVKGLITAKRDGLFTVDRSDTDRVLFSFPLQSEDQAEVIMGKISSAGLDAKVVRGKDNMYRVQTRDADLCMVLAREVWPEQQLSYERKVEHVRQYMVEGCSSYEEAKAMFEKNRDSYNPVNSFTRVSTKLGDGPESSESNGRLLDRGTVVSMPSGAYIITESSVSADSALVRIPADIRREEDVAAFAGKQFENSLVEKKSSKPEVFLSDGTPDGVTKVDGGSLQIASGGRQYDAVHALEQLDLKAWVVLDSPDAVREFASKGEIPAGSVISVGQDVPYAKPGSLVIDLPLSGAADIMKLGSPTGGTSLSDYNSMRDSVARDGMVTCRTVGSLSLKGAKVDGYFPFSELGDRINDDRLDVMGLDRTKEWMNDASLIESVTYTLDPVKSEMRISTVVGGQSRTEVLPLSKEDFHALEYRGVVSKTQLKDFVMQTHPDYFKTYRALRSSPSVKARSIYKDPVGDFLRGTKPERRQPGSAKKEAKQNVSQSQKQGQNKMRP